MLLICAIAMVVCYLTTYGVHSIERCTTKIEPFTVAVMSDGSREFYFDLVDYDYQYSGLMFYTSHQFVEVYNAGKLIYSFNEDGGIWGSTPGSTYNFIEVNEKMLQVAVKVTPAYEIVADQDIDFYIGTSYQMYDDLISKSMPRYIASLLIILFSLLIFVYYYFMHEKQHLDKELVHLAFFAFFFGGWSMNETEATLLMSNNVIFESVVPYVCLMLVVPPFILFFDAYLGLNSKRLKKLFLLVSITQTLVLSVLHLTKIAEFRETLIVTQVMILASGVYMVGGILYQLVKRNITRHVIISTVGLSLFITSMVIDIVKYYKGAGDADTAGRYLYLIFLIMLAWDLIKSTYDMIEKGRRLKQLELFALTDTMTGLFNRNAFESQIKAEKQLDGLTIVVADANGLKACNDTYGHEAGDEYITIVAEIFSNIYSKYGNCYRTGGDEFCCIIPASKEVDIDRLHKLFTAKIYTANLDGRHNYSIGAAIGSAQYDAKLDDGFRALMKRADASMYENKKKTKKIG